MELRHLTEVELPALLDLCRRSLPSESWTLSLRRRRILEQPGYVPTYQLCAWSGGRLLGAMMGCTRPTPDGMVAGVNLFAVDPAYRRQGIATRLLAELERHVNADGLTRLRIGRIAPNYLWPGLDLSYTAALCFLQQHGFQHVGEVYNMKGDLAARDWDTSAAEANLEQRGWLIRRLHPDDRVAFGAWLRTAWSPSWEYEGLAAYQNDPISAFVATHSGQIRAFACYNVSAFENAFGPIGADVEARGLGLGRVLLRRCMAELYALGHPYAEICWVRSFDFYAHTAGANISRVCWFLEKKIEDSTLR